MKADGYTPRFIEKEDFARFRRETADHTFVDAIECQIIELFYIENATYRGADKREALASDVFEAYRASKLPDEIYVYFPWNRHLIRTLGSEDHFTLRTNRNRDLITVAEQKRLAEYRVAVFGMSVGSNIAFALTQSGISREIVIADFDELDTTNLNRMFAGVHEVGLNKCVIAARHIYEQDPFSHVSCLNEGITTDKLGDLLRSKKIDCIIDEVDDMRFKIDARTLAMQYKIPVIMITDNGYGVVLHVERYDLGHDRIFGKHASHFDAIPMAPTKEEAGRIIIDDIVGGADRVDPAMLASVDKVIARNLVSWPQLGIAALLGSAVATYILKGIALGKNTDTDIRAYISSASGNWERHE